MHPLHKQRLQGEAKAHEELGVHVSLLQKEVEGVGIAIGTGGQPRHIMPLFLQQLPQEMTGMEVRKSANVLIHFALQFVYHRA